jgi:rubrerythrin
MRNRKHQCSHQGNFQHWATAGLSFALLTISTTPVPATNSNLDPQTQQAMIEAINDEYQARAFYNAVIDKFGTIRPFINIVQAENRHVELWTYLFNQYGLPLPEDSFAGQIKAPNTLKEACKIAIEAEIANVQMYDQFLGFIEEKDLKAAFTRLRDVSENNHKVAFERCLNSQKF